MDIRQLSADWESWKRFLGQAVEFAEELGISRERIVSLAQQAGQVLTDHVPPASPEQKVMKELWAVADQNEKHVLASLMTKLASQHKQENYVSF